MATRSLLLLGLLLGLQGALAATIAEGEWVGGAGERGGVVDHAHRRRKPARRPPLEPSPPQTVPRIGPLRYSAEYGVCPKYTVKEGDTLFDISKALGVEQGGCRCCHQQPAATACRCWVVGLQ